MSRSKVDLPQPLGPIKTVVLPRSMDKICRMQRRRVRVALANIDKLNQRAHFERAAMQRFLDCAVHGCIRDELTSALTIAGTEIENTKQTRIVRPHLSKLKSGIARERGETFRRVFIGNSVRFFHLRENRTCRSPI